MRITSAQCRAARSLLNWTQEDLANNAAVSRPTITDFESNSRLPMQNNLRSIRDCMFSAGIDFLEEGSVGVGVRFRTPRLEYLKNVRVDVFNDRAKLKMRYCGEKFECVISLHALNDYFEKPLSTEKDYGDAISEILHIVLAIVEREAPTKIEGGMLVITTNMLNP